MGRGNFCYDEGFVVYVEPDEDCEYFADDLFDNLMYDLNKKNKRYYPTKEYDVYKNIAYHLENDFVKINVKQKMVNLIEEQIRVSEGQLEL